MLFLTGRADAYQVNGVVEFTYHDFESKTGNRRESEQSWTQRYGATLQGYLVDPRVLLFSTNVDYFVTSSDNFPDTRAVNYNLHALLFPTLNINGQMHAAEQITTVQSDSNIAGYDIDTIQYGGTLNFRLGRLGRRRGNNNNYYYNNNNYNNNNGNARRGGAFVLPDITLSQNHVESRSLSPNYRLHETLDSTRATLVYRPGSSADLNLTGALERYHNLLDGSSYDNKTVNLASRIAVSALADLKVDGRYTDRPVQGIAGFGTTDKTWVYNMILDVKERNHIRQYYQYHYSHESAQASDSTAHDIGARIDYLLTDAWSLSGGINYDLMEYTQQAIAGLPTQKGRVETGGAQAGTTYSKVYNPDFLGPFSFHTNYGLSYGFSRYSAEAGTQNGKGYFYANTAAVGFSSTGWKKDNIVFDFNFNNKRDHSPLHNNSKTQSIRLSATTRRIPRTSVHAAFSYQENEGSNAVLTPLSASQYTRLQGHSVTYDAAATHTVNEYLTFSAGASRGEAKTSNSYSLATLTPASRTTTIDTTAYANVNFSYRFTRNLQYRLMAEDRYHQTQITHITSYNVEMNIDYRIRHVLVNLQSKWREDIPANALRVEQQYYFVKVTRPF